MSAAMLQVEELSVAFANRDGLRTAVDGVSFRLGAGKTLGLVGESGCGKSTVALALMGLLPGNAHRLSGRIDLDGVELTALKEPAFRPLRGPKISMIFQDPATALNPVRSVGRQLGDVLRRHRADQGFRSNRRRSRRQRVLELLAEVQVPAPENCYRSYPHELSGGLRQRILVAMALACQPRLLIADEPTSALDVTTQAQVLACVQRLARDRGTAVVMISHDLGVVARSCDEVLVMYAGRIVERAPVRALLGQPRHHYTRALLAAARGYALTGESPDRSVEGELSGPASDKGCPYAPRCPRAEKRCRAERPTLAGCESQRVACHFPAAPE